MKAATLFAPAALVAAGFFATPSHADPVVRVGVGLPAISFAFGAPVVYEPAPVETVVVEEDPYWVWVPGVGYEYWTYGERVRYEREHFVHLERRGYEHQWRDHERWERERHGRDWERERRWDRREVRHDERREWRDDRHERHERRDDRRGRVEHRR